MRLSTKRKAPLIHFLNTLFLLLFVLGIVAFVVNYKLRFMAHNYLFLVLSSWIALLYLIRGRENFYYDSDGEVLHIKNESTLPFFWVNKNDEFPKYKLREFNITNNLLYKKLYLKIESKTRKDIVLRYDISYLTHQEVKDLYRSLNKIITKNKAQHQ